MNSGTVARYTNGQLIEGRPRCNNTFPGYANGGCYYFTAASNGTYIFDEQTGSFVEINNVNRPRFTHDLNINMYGGTINGSLHISDVGTLYIGKGDWIYPALVSNTNSGFYAISGNSPNQAGEFICRANKDNSNFIDLTGRPDGMLSWNSKPVVSIIYEAGGIITYSNALTFQWGSAYGSTTVNFPQPFSGYPIVYTTNNSVSDTSCNATTYVTGITPTYFTTYKIRGNSGNQVQDGGQFSWFALGYR